MVIQYQLTKNKKFFEYIAKPVNEEGHSQAILDEYNSDIDTRLFLTYLRYNKFDLKNLVKEAVAESKVKSLKDYKKIIQELEKRNQLKNKEEGSFEDLAGINPKDYIKMDMENRINNQNKKINKMATETRKVINERQDLRPILGGQSLAKALAIAPDLVNTKLTFEMGWANEGLELSFLTEGQGNMEAISNPEGDYVWDVMGARVLTTQLISANSLSGNVGQGGSQFKLNI